MCIFNLIVSYGFTRTAHTTHISHAVHWCRARSGNLTRLHPDLRLGHAWRQWARSQQCHRCWSRRCLPRSRLSLQVLSNLISLVIIVGLLKFSRDITSLVIIASLHFTPEILISLPRLCSGGAAHYALGPCRLCYCC